MSKIICNDNKIEWIYYCNKMLKGCINHNDRQLLKIVNKLKSRIVKFNHVSDKLMAKIPQPFMYNYRYIGSDKSEQFAHNNYIGV